MQADLGERDPVGLLGRLGHLRLLLEDHVHHPAAGRQRLEQLDLRGERLGRVLVAGDGQGGLGRLGGRVLALGAGRRQLGEQLVDRLGPLLVVVGGAELLGERLHHVGQRLAHPRPAVDGQPPGQRREFGQRGRRLGLEQLVGRAVGGEPRLQPQGEPLRPELDPGDDPAAVLDPLEHPVEGRLHRLDLLLAQPGDHPAHLGLPEREVDERLELPDLLPVQVVDHVEVDEQRHVGGQERGAQLRAHRRRLGPGVLGRVDVGGVLVDRQGHVVLQVHQVDRRLVPAGARLDRVHPGVALLERLALVGGQERLAERLVLGDRDEDGDGRLLLDELGDVVDDDERPAGLGDGGELAAFEELCEPGVDLLVQLGGLVRGGGGEQLAEPVAGLLQPVDVDDDGGLGRVRQDDVLAGGLGDGGRGGGGGGCRGGEGGGCDREAETG